MAQLLLEWRLFLLAVQFLTRLPVPRDLPFSDDLVIRSVKYYPAVGALVGALGALVFWLAGLVVSPVVAVLLSLAATLMVTGGFHEDGLADTADGLGGGATREKALAIMRDSRLGAFGAMALIVVLGMKVALLTDLGEAALMALVLGHVVSRMAAVHIIATTDYARREGSKFAAPKVTQDGYRWALSISLAALALGVLILGTGAALCGALGAVVFGQAMRWLGLRKLDGYTGDTLGAVQQLSEVGLYLGVLVWL